jgi:hypothetical protein
MNSQLRYSDMPHPSKTFTDKLIVNRHIRNSNTQSKRREVDRKIINKLGQSYSSKFFKKAHHQNKHGKYGLSALSLSETIERSQAKAKAAAKAKAEAEATLQKEAKLQAEILKQILGGQQQIAGYKKAKPKKK